MLGAHTRSMAIHARDRGLPENWMSGQSGEEGLVHRYRLLERGEVLGLQLLLHLVELLFGQVA